MCRQSVSRILSILSILSKASWAGLLLVGSAATSAVAQTDLKVTGPQAGFPVAIPQMCDEGNAGEYARKIPETIQKNLDLSGLFKVLPPSSYVETPGKCANPEQIQYSDWTVIGADGLVRGEMKVNSAGMLEARLYLYDVQQRKTVIAKQYESDPRDATRIAHRFSNEIMKFFTGEKGIFGTRIAFVSKVGRFKELFVVDLDSSNLKQLTRDTGIVLSPSWSPDGSTVAYTSFRTKKPELYTMNVDSGSQRQLTKREGLEMGAKFAKDGGSIVASASTAGVSNLVTFDLSGRMLRTLTNSSNVDISPSLSPDGGQLAFCSNRAGGPQVFVMSAGGGEARRLSYTSSNYCTSPAWSPKGEQIAFVCRTGGFQIYVAPAAGGAASQLTFTGDNEDPSWSPDGRYLMFSSTGYGGRKIMILPLQTGIPKAIETGRSDDSQPSWSPLPE